MPPSSSLSVRNAVKTVALIDHSGCTPPISAESGFMLCVRKERGNGNLADYPTVFQPETYISRGTDMPYAVSEQMIVFLTELP